jgi:DNA-binding winged helix-turn-helix (wHTH) protein
MSGTSSGSFQDGGPVRVQVGEFLLDGDARGVSRDGRRLALSPKALPLLEVLVTERPR